MLRGLAGGMGVDFSVCEQWAPYARAALAEGARTRTGPCVTAPTDEWERVMSGTPLHVEEVAVEEAGVLADDHDGGGFVTVRAEGLGLVPLAEEEGGDKVAAPPLH